MRSRIHGVMIGLLALSVITTHEGLANPTISGTITDCSGRPIGNCTVDIAAKSASSSCTGFDSPVACRVTDLNGQYSYSPPVDPNNAIKYCISAIPEGDEATGCASCTEYVCCGGSKPVRTTTSVTIPANTSSGSYTANIGITYSGSCNTSAGEITVTPNDCTSNSIKLTWSAPSEGGCALGAYDIRYSSSVITDGNWASATQLSGEPTPSAPTTPEVYWASVPSSCSWYYFAMKSQLHDGGWSTLSNIVYARTKCPPSTNCEIGD